MARTIFIVGGARSGKSRFALDLAYELGGDEVLVVATAEAGDAEMTRRIDRHKLDRPPTWELLEFPIDVGRSLAGRSKLPEVIVVDCLTLLVSNLVCGGADQKPQTRPHAPLCDAEIQMRIDGELEALWEVFESHRGTVILVSSEVGQGVVPAYPLGRLFRDVLGWANQDCAARAAEVYWMVAGLPIESKRLAVTAGEVARGCHENSAGRNTQ